MRLLALALSLATVCAVPAVAQTSSLGTGIVGTNAIQTCGPVVDILGDSGLGDAVTMPCAGAPNYTIKIEAVAGQPALIGTISSVDTTSGAGRRLIKEGVEQLEVSFEKLDGTQGTLNYKTVNGGGDQTLRLSAYTSGQAKITITGQYTAHTVNINGGVHTAEDVAIRQGRAYTVSTGMQAVSANNFLSLQITNPAGSNERAFITTRAIGCTATAATEFAGTSNPTTNLATNALTVTKRNANGVATAITAAYVMATTHPDTNPAAALPAGGTVPANGVPAVLGTEFTRTLEPGSSFVNWVGGAGGGLAAAARCYITAVYYSVPTQ